ncbi:DUF3080 family protein [Endozoicomonas sp. SM1973]|uniref:DUF3080 family protein n=1 Tax=Spartinivicinus marinus TaxID=2994442 RepID=A0A853I577_9GAMM|nr:DUF3080 family protein [Spartinivicinus marinus]MCX4030009.1 DUF3080 family protein [Spartinivicinus marinus]NYZ64747.1 DUF3080 family protein [Spartinivicinus marinus]
MTVGLLLVTLFVSSCNQQPSTQSMMENYLSRVARTLDIDNKSPQPAPLKLNLDKRILRLPLPDVRLDLFDVLAITHCQPLTQKLAERNSALGKVMATTHRFIFEVTLLEAINQCLAHPETQSDNQLVKQLLLWQQQKNAALPATLWNNLFATDEMLLSLSFSTLPLAPNEPRAEGTIAALTFFTAQAKHMPDKLAHLAPQPTWDQHFQQLYQRRYVGELSQATQLAIASLTTVSHWLEQQQKTRPLCPQNTPTPRARILHTVFKKFYIGEVQPYLAHLNQLQIEWQQVMQRLLQQLSTQSIHPTWLQFERQLIGQPNQPALQFILFKQATKRHARAWEQLLQQCRLMPQLSV